MYKKGDLVKVYSLQSFFGGGFLNGNLCVVYQDQNGSSVLVTVSRNFGSMNYRLYFSYEVYEKQLEKIISFEDMNSYHKNKLEKIFENYKKYHNLTDEEKLDFEIKYQKLMNQILKKHDKNQN